MSKVFGSPKAKPGARETQHLLPAHGGSLTTPGRRRQGAGPAAALSALTGPHFISFNLQKGNEMITLSPEAELSRAGLQLKAKHSVFFIK